MDFEGRMPPTPAKMRERSRHYRKAARNAVDLATKRKFAAKAFALAQVAEAIEREGESDRSAKIERYARLLSEVLNERSPYIREPLDHRELTTAQREIKAWRIRAEELRATADQFEVPSAQEALRRASTNYDKLADQAEALLTKRKSPPSRKSV
jgi:hypothetical protein